jgi:hypothetical protein
LTSAEKIKSLKTIRGKDVKIRYTQDNFEDTLVNQRQFYDENNDILTPVTPKLLERQIVTNNPTIARIGSTQPRYVSACFGSPNKPGERSYKIIIPYHPTGAGHNEHIQEILDYSAPSQLLEPKLPLSLIYHGEDR